MQKAEGRLALAECLQWEPFDEEKDMQRSIELDYFYDNIMFAVNKGFSWDKVVTVFEFAGKLLQEIKDCENITDILAFYNVISVELCDSLGEREYKVFTEYIFSTALVHFKLIKFIFTTPRKVQTPHVSMHVNPPFDPNVLKQSKPVKVWEYEQMIGELEKKEEERANERLTEKGKKMTEMEMKTKEAVNSAVSSDKPLDKDSIQKIMEDVMKAYSLAATENIKANILQLEEDLEFKLAKTSLPRPQALGPPPRYNLPTSAKGKTPSSGKKGSPPPGSRASTRAKKK